MNSNFLRTLLMIGAGVLAVLPVFLGCVLDTQGSFDCSASILPPQFAGLGAMVLMGLAMVIKAFDGTGLFSTTSAGFRTALTVIGIIVTGVTIFAGCSTDVTTGMVICTATWLSPKVSGLVAALLVGANQMIKAFDGTTLTKPVK